MVAILEVLKEEAQCDLCGNREKEVAKVKIDERIATLCQKHAWAMAKMNGKKEE